MKIARNVFGFIAALGMASMAHAAPLLIDHFYGDQNFATTIPDGPVTDTYHDATGTLGILGNYRSITLTPGGTDDFAVLRARTGDFTASGESLRVDNGGGMQGIVDVLWDANGAGLGVDLSLFTDITVDVLAIDLSTSVSFTLTDSDGVFHTAGPSVFGGPGTFVVDLDAFVDAGVNVADIDAIRMTMTGDDAWDGTFDLVEAVEVPVPAPVALLGMGLLGLALVRRKIA